MALTRLAHQLVRQHFANKPRVLAIDATCGNGHDTEFLARLGFEKVLGFDIQSSAIENTHKRLLQAGLKNVTLHLDGHQNMLAHLKGEQLIDCVMFNFGYLPHGDKSITTEADSSLKALKVALDNLNSQGMICLICYPGHEQGAIESTAIADWLANITTSWRVQQHLSKSPKIEAPVLYTITSTEPL